MADERDSLIEFPCTFPIKVMGRADTEFALRVTEIVREHVPDLRDEDVRTAASRRGNFVSVTVTVTARSQAHLDRVYLALNADEQVLMTL